ncbi:glycosyl transferase family 90 [Salibaculum sp.]|uniref:glycosyl transferase family 90 n=1 Tax=Salibaculum sp. TaxID=2855480 RepID=UPI002B49CDDB|nr:glycosyl transferase family 90 [Salibaculum sp.]HKL68979.1 glycosyl transferase family 90 [Salibaculum sp.]
MIEAPVSRIFLIGFNRCGGAWFRDAFQAAGVRWRHDRTGELAADIAWHAAAGTRPLERWPRLVGISGLQRWNKPHLPKVEAFRHFAFLETQFPDALFIYNDRDPADWIASRFFQREGRFADCEARHEGCHRRDLPQIWLKDRAAHKLRVLRHFEGNPRFLHFDLSHDPDAKLVNWAAPWVRLGELPADRGVESAARNVVQIDALAEDLHTRARRPRHRPGRPDSGFVDAVAAHCLGTAAEAGDNGALSPAAAFWTPDGTIEAKLGHPLPLLRSGDGPYLAERSDQARDRVQAVVNGLLELGAHPPLTIDMQDAREAGTGGRPVPAQRTLVYNRRPGAANLVLWPLPGYHDLAPEGRPGAFAADEVAFEDKPDLCLWFGNLTGKPLPHLAPGLGQRRMAHHYLRELAQGPDDAMRQQIGQALSAVTRYRVVSRLHGRPGFEMGFVLPPKHEKAGEDRMLAHLVTRRVPDTWVQQGRYVLSLSGNDTGSNFLSAAASNAVVLKEEDEWELFYTAAFRPWEHYIPLAPGGDDIEDRLDWARSHPGHCKEIAAASRALVAKFAAPENRRAWMAAVLEVLGARRAPP